MISLSKVALIVGLMAAPLLGAAQSSILVWQDEFEGAGLPDNTKWGYDVGGDGWGNNELQYYTGSDTNNARVHDGKLIIEAHKESYLGKDYTSARLITKNRGDWRYGRVEVRAKVPAGTGTWPAIWMLPTDWEYGGWPASGEIDIMEYVGYDPNVIHHSVHTQDYNHVNGTEQTSSVSVATAEEEFHVYAIEWTEDKIDFFTDDVLRFTFENEGTWQKWPFDKRFHLLLNVAIGGNWGGAHGVDDSIFPVQMEVDYVRVYQQPNEFQIAGETYIQPFSEQVEFSIANAIEGDFEWSVPADAEIVSGQGTNTISVNWGNTEGDVAVEMTVNDETYNYSRPVHLLTVPVGEDHMMDHFDDQNIENISYSNNDDNSFSFSEENSELKVSYQIADPGLWPKFIVDFENPIDLSGHQSMQVRLKTFNNSGSVRMRVDLMDKQGRQTNANPVFEIEPAGDGQYHDYHYNFAGNWSAGAPNFGETVNREMIQKAVVYLNYGFYGIDNASDSLWIDFIKMNSEPLAFGELRKDLKISVTPNPATTYFTIPETEQKIDRIRILDMTGRVVKETYYNTNRVKIGGLPQGVYMVLLFDESNALKYRTKLIKSNY